MGIYLSYILYGDFSHTFCMGISLIHFVWDSTFFLLKSGPSSGTGKAPIAEGRALLEVEVLQYHGGALALDESRAAPVRSEWAGATQRGRGNGGKVLR